PAGWRAAPEAPRRLRRCRVDAPWSRGKRPRPAWAPARRSWGCGGPRSLRRIFPEGPAPDRRRHASGDHGRQGTEAGEQPRPDEALDHVVLHRPAPISRGRGRSVETAADRLDDERLGLLELGVAARQRLEDPPREHLLDRAVEGPGGKGGGAG